MSNYKFLNLRKKGKQNSKNKNFVCNFFTSPTLLLEILKFAIESFVNAACLDFKKSFGVIVVVP